jgi:hypothetical protein
MLFSSQVYSEFTFNTEFSQLPSDVVEFCKLILLDAVGAAAAATGVMQSSGFITSYARTAWPRTAFTGMVHSALKNLKEVRENPSRW